VKIVSMCRAGRTVSMVCVLRLQVVLGVDDIRAAIDINSLDTSCIADHLLGHCSDSADRQRK